MKYNKFQDTELSALGFGCMRLPVLDDGETIDENTLEIMVDKAIKAGINYFDTAWPYHEGNSEIVVGNILSKYPRESFYIASKMPLRQFCPDGPLHNTTPKDVFEKQLKKCRVEYFDFYLLHNVSESTLPVLDDEKLDILNYLLEEKKNGRIKHLGFSSHAQFKNLKTFVKKHPNVFEFCQIQLNYLDWTLQEAKEKYEFLTNEGIPVWVMEGIRGGRLANLTDNQNARLNEIRPNESAAAWAIRWVQKLPNVCVQLSGMSTIDQVEDNLKTMSAGMELSDKEFNMLIDIAEELKNSVPCTKCRYCCDGCPQELNIPDLIASYNELMITPVPSITMYINSLPEDKRPSACIACGQCTTSCPQNINVPNIFKDFTERLSKLHWR